MNTAIIVAAGSGTRFDSTTPKQFLDLLGKPVIIHTLEQFQNCDAIDEIVAVVSEGERETMTALKDKFRISKLLSIVAGGTTRGHSVRNGVNAGNPNASIVCVHDGVRPLVTTDEIARTVRCAEENGAACLVAPVTDTIKSVEYGKITGTVDRAKLRRALTPQAFRYDILKQALDGADLDESVTDECVLVEKIGVMVTTVEGSARNIKITHRGDLILAAALLREEDR